MSKASDYIKTFTRHCSNELVSVECKDGKKIISFHEWLTPENALAAAELAKEEAIEKACEWLSARCSDARTDRYFIEDFKQAMKL